MRHKILHRIDSLRRDESGATAIEYALIGSLISTVIIGALLLLNGSMTDVYSQIRGAIIPILKSANSEKNEV